MKDYSLEIASKISSYLDNNDIDYRFDSENGIFSMGIGICEKIRKIDYIISIEENSFCVLAISPVSSDAENKTIMAELCEFFTRANYGLVMGNFELDLRDGEIRYKVHMYCEDMELSENAIAKCILCPLSMFKRYGDGIIEICFNGGKAEETIKKCEGKSISEQMKKGIRRMLLAKLLSDSEAKPDEMPDIDEILSGLTDDDDDLTED